MAPCLIGNATRYIIGWKLSTFLLTETALLVAIDFAGVVRWRNESTDILSSDISNRTLARHPILLPNWS